MDLDPKGANNQIKEAIDKRYLPDDEEPVTPVDYIFYSSKYNIVLVLLITCHVRPNYKPSGLKVLFCPIRMG